MQEAAAGPLKRCPYTTAVFDVVYDEIEFRESQTGETVGAQPGMAVPQDGFEEGRMPTIEGREGKLWIDAYVKKAGKLAGVAKAVRTLVKKSAPRCEEYVSPWKTPAFDSNGPLCVLVLVKDYVTLAFLRGAMLSDPEKLLEGKAMGVRNVKMRSLADVKRAGVKRLIVEAAKLNKKDPPSGKMVGMDKRRTKERKK